MKLKIYMRNNHFISRYVKAWVMRDGFEISNQYIYSIHELNNDKVCMVIHDLTIDEVEKIEKALEEIL